MNQTKLCLAGALLAFLAICASAQINRKTAPYTNPTDGRQLYVNLCASCHGADLRGSPTAAAVIKPTPLDLTRISARDQGFNREHVYEHIANRDGLQPMPNWSLTLHRMYWGNEGQEQQAIHNLVKFVESQQQ